MRPDCEALFARLHELGIPTTTVEHPPVFTVEQSASLRTEIPGAHTKTLFLTDKDGHKVLVVAKDDTRVDLKAPGGSASPKANCSRPCSVLQPVRLRRWR